MWQSILKSNITTVDRLISFLELSELDKKKILRRPRFGINIPLRIARKMEKGTLNDPLVKQFVSLVEEEDEVPQFVDNPVGDCEAVAAPKLLHKYCGRSLILTTSACAMHCRFCFRKEFDYAVEAGFEEELEKIGADPSVSEVILSGGDPLSLSDRKLGELLGRLNAMPHVERVRFHTRFIVGIPERVDAELLEALRRFEKTKVFVFHINHPRELDGDVLSAIDRLKEGKPVLFSQSVLLRGVNDSVDVLKCLFLKLIDCGVVPYYLHQLDRVRGAAHFEVPLEEGEQLIEEIRKVLPGYAIPSYVQEIAKMPYKMVIT